MTSRSPRTCSAPGSATGWPRPSTTGWPWRAPSGSARRSRRSLAWRLRTGNYGFPLEHKAFHTYVKLTKQTKADKLNAAAQEIAAPGLDQTVGLTTSAPVYTRPGS